MLLLGLLVVKESDLQITFDDILVTKGELVSRTKKHTADKERHVVLTVHVTLSTQCHVTHVTAPPRFL